MRHPCGWVEPGHTLKFDDTPLSSGTHLLWTEEMMDDETVIPVLVFSLSVVVLIGLNGCDRQDPPSKTVHKLSQLPDTVVGGMARSAIDKAKKLRQRWERLAIGQSRPVRKGRRKPEMLKVWTW